MIWKMKRKKIFTMLDLETNLRLKILYNKQVLKKIIINLYLITCRHCNRKWKRNWKINLECNDWKMYKTMLNKINLYNLKIMLYFKKYKCNYWILIFVLCLNEICGCDKVNYLSKVHYSTYTLHIRPQLKVIKTHMDK